MGINKKRCNRWLAAIDKLVCSSSAALHLPNLGTDIFFHDLPAWLCQIVGSKFLTHLWINSFWRCFLLKCLQSSDGALPQWNRVLFVECVSGASHISPVCLVCVKVHTPLCVVCVSSGVAHYVLHCASCGVSCLWWCTYWEQIGDVLLTLAQMCKLG